MEAATQPHETRVLFKDIDEPLTSIETYERRGGYTALKRAFRDIEPGELVSAFEESGLRGRGGAGFSMGKKASFLPRGEMQKYLCCNADESEPGTFKDRELMFKNPHGLVEGVAIGAMAAGATKSFIFIRGEYAEIADRLDAAVAEAYEAGYLGENILGTGIDVSIVVHRGAGAYICGEETALLDSLEGKRGNPRLKPPFPAVQGLYGGPTLINNVETLSNVPHVVANGAEWFRSFGTEQSPGTKVVSISGCVGRPGNYEVELGVNLRDFVFSLGGGMLEGRELKALYPGGLSSSPGRPRGAQPLRLRDDRGGGLGAQLGAIGIADDTVCSTLACGPRAFYPAEVTSNAPLLPRALAPDREDARARRPWRATPMDLDICSPRCRTTSSATACASSAARWRSPVTSMVKPLARRVRDGHEGAQRRPDALDAERRRWRPRSPSAAHSRCRRRAGQPGSGLGSSRQAARTP